MNADQFIEQLSNAVFVFILGAVTVEALRRPAAATLHAVAFFGILAFLVLLGIVVEATAGYELAVYTVNDPERAVELAAWGAQYFITDRPDLIIDAL